MTTLATFTTYVDISEARFTAPHPDCPHPQRWTSTDDDSTEHQVTTLVAAFVTALQPDLVVETGSAWGQTSEAIAHALTHNTEPGGQLVTIEPDPHRAQHTRDRCAGLPVTVVCGSSLDWTPPAPIGFAWFDSLIHLRAAEYRRYLPWLTPGTVVGFHDTGPQHNLRPTIDQLAAQGLLAPIYLPTPRGVCFATVTTGTRP